jgi:O-antigen ligase
MTAARTSRAERAAPPALAVGLPAVALFAVWALLDGGYAPGAWYPGALVVVVALGAVLLSGRVVRPSRAGRWALAALAAFTAWSFASIAWATARGVAWDAANRALLYLTVFALFVLLPWRRREAAVLLTAFVLATAAAGAAGIGEVRAWRLAGPTGYSNASAALFMAALWPAVVLAAQRPVPPWARGLLLAAAGVLAELVVLAQSRGSLLAGAAGLGAALALVAQRGRLLVALAAVAVPVVLTLPVLARVYAHEGGAVTGAAVAIAVTAAVLLAAGLASGWLDGRAPHRRVRAGWPAAGAAALAGVALWASTMDTRLTEGAGTGRYDFWRVAAGQLARHPVQGAGAGNFAHDHLRERRGREEPLYPHSVVIGTLGQTGLVGGLLLAGFLAAGFAGGRASACPARRAVAAAALVSVAAWLAQASIDWLWELPAVTAPAMGLLGLAVSLGRADDVPLPRAAGPAVAVATLAAASYVAPALAARDVERAVREPAEAAALLDRARRLNPLSPTPDLVAGALAVHAGDERRARSALRRAAAREPEEWWAQAQLARLDGDPVRRRLAAALNPLGGAPGRDVVPGPLGRVPLDCRPVLGLGAGCAGGVR